MNSNFSHSAEGSSWTKKNHKYIRKEGNRYIYPEDLKTSRHDPKVDPKIRSNSTTPSYVHNINSKPSNTNRVTIRSGSGRQYKVIDQFTNTGSANDRRRLSPVGTREKHVSYVDLDSKNSNNVKKPQKHVGISDSYKTEPIRRKTLNKQGSPDYKKLSEQHANRKAAANGKVVNPTYNMKDESGKTIFRIHSNDKVMPTAAQSYAKEQTLQKKQAANRSSNGSNAKNQEYAKKQVSAQKRKSALSKQGSSNRYQDAKDFKEYQDWERNDLKKRNIQPVKASKEYYDEVRSNSKNDEEFYDYLDKHNVARPDGSKSQKVETRDNSKNIKTWDNTAVKKSTKGQKGHFTLKDGKTVFVSDDPATNKRVNKGKRIVDKVKGLFNKK